MNWWHILILYWGILIATVSDWKHTQWALAQWIIVEPHCQFIIIVRYLQCFLYFGYVCSRVPLTYILSGVSFVQCSHAISLSLLCLYIAARAKGGMSSAWYCMCICVCALQFCSWWEKNWTRPLGVGMSSLRSCTPTHMHLSKPLTTHGRVASLMRKSPRNFSKPNRALRGAYSMYNFCMRMNEEHENALHPQIWRWIYVIQIPRFTAFALCRMNHTAK